MRYTTLTQAQYEILRNAIAEATEGFEPLPYDDNGALAGGFPTVGIGIRTDIVANVDSILSILGIDPNTANGSVLHNSILSLSGNTNQLINGWNNAFDVYNGVSLTPPSGNNYPLSITQARDIKSLVYQSREDDLTDAVEITNLLGGGTVENFGTNDPMDIGDDANEIPYSVERATFADLQFNGVGMANSPSLRNGAILENAGNLTNGTNANIVISDAYARSIAYYEIAYNSNANQSFGLGSRRVVEASNLGLYDSDATIKEFATTAQFFNNLSGYRGNAFDLTQDINSEITNLGTGRAIGDNNFHGTAYADATINRVNNILLANNDPAIPLIQSPWFEASNINIFFNLGQTISATGQDWDGTKLALYTQWKAVLAAQTHFSEIGIANFDIFTLNAATNIAFTHYQDNGNLIGSLINSNYLFGGSGNNTLTGGFATDVLFGFGGNDALNGGAGDDILVGGSGNDTLNGGVGHDIVDYTSLSGSVTATITGTGATVVKTAGGVDTLSGIEAIFGTAQADAFIINTLAQGVPIMINGGSALISPQELPGTKNATIAEVLTPPSSGGRYLSAAQLAAASGVLFNHEDQDTVTIAQSLLDAGAQVTYYSTSGEGVIYLNGVQIGYTGIFHASELLAA